MFPKNKKSEANVSHIPSLPQSRGHAHTPWSHFGLLLGCHAPPSSGHCSPAKSADLKRKHSIKKMMWWLISTTGSKTDFPHPFIPTIRQEWVLSGVWNCSFIVSYSDQPREFTPICVFTFTKKSLCSEIKPSPDFGDCDPKPLIHVWLMSVCI